jgi:hypothetical protein
MNGIPTTFNDGLPSYTVVDGGERCGPRGISAVLLSRGKVNRERLYQGLMRAGFERILSIEERDPDSDLSSWAAAYPFVRFILLNEPLPAGSQINLAAAELSGDYFFVLRKDCGLEPHSAESIMTTVKEARNLCSVPPMFDRGGTALPTLPLIEFSSGILRTRMAVPGNGSWHLFPFEGIGVYNRDLFVRLGGFDNSITDEYWQLMDFGLRAHTWGERIRTINDDTVRITRGTGLAKYALFIGESYRRFYLKNLSPVYRLDAAYLPLRRFPFFLFKSGMPIPDAWDEFSMARAWVSLNAYRWKCDVHTLIKNWGQNGKKDAS